MGTKLLYGKRPLVVNPELAILIGLDGAILLQQVHYWLEINRKAEKNNHEGRWWTYNTYEGWVEQFPFWNVLKVKRVVRDLEDRGLLICGNFNKHPMDRTKWYSIDYEALERLETQDSSPKYQNDTMHSIKMTPAIPESNSENRKQHFRQLQEMDLVRKVSRSSGFRKFAR